MERKFLFYAQAYVNGQIARIESDLALGIYGEEPTKKLKEQLSKWESERTEITKTIIYSGNN